MYVCIVYRFLMYDGVPVLGERWNGVQIDGADRVVVSCEVKVR